VYHSFLRVLNFIVLHLNLGEHLGNFNLVKRLGGVSSIFLGNLLLFSLRKLRGGLDWQFCKNAFSSPVHFWCHHAETGTCRVLLRIRGASHMLNRWWLKTLLMSAGCELIFSQFNIDQVLVNGVLYGWFAAAEQSRVGGLTYEHV